MAVVLETPFDPQALFTALNYVSNVFNAASWQNLLKLFFMVALINGIVSVGIYRKTDYIKQFILALGFASLLSVPVNDNLAIKRADTERVYTINNSKAPFVLVEGIKFVNSVTKFFTAMAGASINSPNYTGMYDAGIGSHANIIRNSMDATFKDPKIKADVMQFIKECTFYDIRDGAVSLDALIERGNGFNDIFNNTSPARFVSINSTSGRPEVKTCQEAARYLDTKISHDAQLTMSTRAANFFYSKDMAPLTIYATAVQSSYQTQLGINANLAQITKQNMFNHLLEVSGQDIGRLIGDPTMAESAAIHTGVARAAKKASFQQSIIAQLGKEILPAMSSWFAIIIIMLFPFVVLIFVITQFNNMWQILVGYMGTLFWICCWQPIFAIINGLANWELGRQLAKTGAFRQEGIPYGFVTPVYDTLLSNHSMVGWMVMLTPIIAGMVVYGTYRGFSHLGNSIFSTFSGAGSAVGHEMSDGNLNMGNTNLGNSSISNASQNTTSANKYNSSMELNSGIASINNARGSTHTFFASGEMVTEHSTDSSMAHFDASKIIGTSFTKTGSTSSTSSNSSEISQKSSNSETDYDVDSTIISNGISKETGNESQKGVSTGNSTITETLTQTGVVNSNYHGGESSRNNGVTNSEVINAGGNLNVGIGSGGKGGGKGISSLINIGIGGNAGVSRSEDTYATKGDSRVNGRRQSIDEINSTSTTTSTSSGYSSYNGSYERQANIYSNMKNDEKGNRSDHTESVDAAQSVSFSESISYTQDQTLQNSQSFGKHINLGEVPYMDTLIEHFHQSNPELFHKIVTEDLPQYLQQKGMNPEINSTGDYYNLRYQERSEARKFLTEHAFNHSNIKDVEDGNIPSEKSGVKADFDTGSQNIVNQSVAAGLNPNRLSVIKSNFGDVQVKK